MVSFEIANEIIKEKSQGALNIDLMKKYKLSYEELRSVLDSKNTVSQITVVNRDVSKKPERVVPMWTMGSEAHYKKIKELLERGN